MSNICVMPVTQRCDVIYRTVQAAIDSARPGDVVITGSRIQSEAWAEWVKSVNSSPIESWINWPTAFIIITVAVCITIIWWKYLDNRNMIDNNDDNDA